jgi:hypothetical protein
MKYALVLLLIGLCHGHDPRLVGTWEYLDTVPAPGQAPYLQQIHVGFNSVLESRSRTGVPPIQINQTIRYYLDTFDSIFTSASLKSISIGDSGGPNEAYLYADFARPRYKFTLLDSQTMALGDTLCQCSRTFRLLGKAKVFTLPDWLTLFPDPAALRPVPAQNQVRYPSRNPGEYAYGNRRYNGLGKLKAR